MKENNPTLYKHYHDYVVPIFLKDYGYANVMSVPKITKITLNMGLGSASRDKKVLEKAKEYLVLISSQKPVICNARKSVASFKVRTGMPIGCKVTLRKKNMYSFLDRLINIAVPRFRDFRGLSKKSFDEMGNYNMGVKDVFVFPEVDFANADTALGFDINFTTTAKNSEEAFLLLKTFNFPFQE